MEQLGRTLARVHDVGPARAADRLLARLDENRKLIGRARSLLDTAVHERRRLTPADEWLLDNFHRIEEQIQIALRHLPKRYSRELPLLTDASGAGLPRCYDIATEAIAHGDGRLDSDRLERFVSAYQTVTPLKLGELWAIPIMLRLALIENLRRISARIIADRAHRDLAGSWADRFIAIAASDPKNIVLELADMARSRPPLTTSFIAELTRRLRGQGPVLALPLGWTEQWLATSGQSIERMVNAENRRQAEDQVSIANSIGSLSFLERQDWREFVEKLSVVEHVLRKDPDATYARMDFATRNQYRRIVERIARRGRLPEHEVAQAALDLARASAASTDGEPIASHIGYYLLDAGRAQLERTIRLRGGLAGAVRRTVRRVPLLAYMGPTVALTALFAFGLLVGTYPQLEQHGLLYPVAVLCVIAFSELGVALVNWIATETVPPLPLPRLDFSEGVPDDARTLVVVPTMLGDAATAQALAEALEVRFIANRDPNIKFALLTDFFDADQRELAGDAAVMEAAQGEIDALNARYAVDGDDVFFLFHRPRMWNARERKWMGYERKRGKLTAINALLRGAADPGTFLRIAGKPQALQRIRNVITLDTDTRLPRDAAWQMIGTLAHPLNRPAFDPRRRVVTRGYAILQPRIDIRMRLQGASWYARLFGSEAGIDPYTRTVSDVYQDLFGEGSFIGKGIYDIDAFTRALDDRFPENRILSHDLLEGCYARAGLVSDVNLLEDYPSRYAIDVKRRHRWIRGDWQLLPWLLPWTPLPGGRRERNPLSMLSLLKLFDNLRRSLVPAAILAMLWIGWMVSPTPGRWTAWTLSILFVPPLAAWIRRLLKKPAGLPLDAHFRQATANGTFPRILLNLACLPFEAWFSLGAIVRTLWRLLLSRRHLLQWNPSSEVERTLGAGLLDSVRLMWFGPFSAIATAAVLWRFDPRTFAIASPLLLLWMLSPLAMWWTGRPRAHRLPALSQQQTRFLGMLARRTWRFFETTVTADDHWIPPDNLQEYPTLQLARRTSPTNMGLSLLSDLSAYDFGYLQLKDMIERTAGALHTIESLPRFRGHFYNWYDTRTLQPLFPYYISTVDSGNLAGHLLTLRQGLLALADAPILSPRTWTGLGDTCRVLAETVAGQPESAVLRSFEDACDAASASPPSSLLAAGRTLEELMALAQRIDADHSSRADDGAYWAHALLRQCLAAQDALHEFAPWLQSGLVPADAVGVLGSQGPIPSLADIVGCGEPDPASGTAESAACDGARRAQARIDELHRLAHAAGQCAQMDFGFLYDHSRKLLSIGYSATEHRLDPGYYDLLASEARLASFVAIAQNQLPQESWFALGRLLTDVDGVPALVSWSGSMFEYLMPQLVMPSYEDTLLDRTAEAVVDRQIQYGLQRKVPWGISESGYNIVDAHSNYQYRAFGIPGLGLKRGLAQDLVIAPYASMLALMVAPQEACNNLQRLWASGFGGRFGLHEAIDYTPGRLPSGHGHALIRSYMAHHQGMGLLSLSHLLHDRPMQKRFVADVQVQATLPLLQERVHAAGIINPHPAETDATRYKTGDGEMRLRVFRTPTPSRPAVQLLSNGRYHLMISAAGGGYSRWNDIAVTRWREDATRDAYGNFCFLSDLESGLLWSTTHQPTLAPIDGYEAIFSDAKAEFRGHVHGIDVHTEIAVSPEDDIELRRLKISNLSDRPRSLEITTYAEVVLAPGISDELHPAFSNLFVQTELVPEKQAILCTRRPRSLHESPPWLLHLMAIHDAEVETISYETDRSRFIGRGNALGQPQALRGEGALSNSAGAVLDPIVAIRCRLTLVPGQAATIDMVTGVAPARENCTALIDKYRDRRLADRVFDLSWTHSQVVRQQIDVSQSDAQIYENLAGLVIYPHALLRAGESVLMQNTRGQSGLWSQAISGDHPVVLVQISDLANIELVQQMMQAHAYWRLKGLVADLVIWNEDQTGYRQQLQDQIMGLVTASASAELIDKPGGIFVRAMHMIPIEERILLQSVARIIVSDAHGSLREQADRTLPPLPMPPLLATTVGTEPGSQSAAARFDAASDPEQAVLREGADSTPEPWPFLPPLGSAATGNGLGELSPDGREYVIELQPGRTTPAPWSNVLANAGFGCVVSESTLGYTWGENAHEFRLTPWHNDPVGDTGGEALYLRDESSGRVWSPTPLPCRGGGSYRIRHGFGYSVFEHVQDGIASELEVFVDRNDAVKYSVLRLRNLGARRRQLSVTGYVEWVLGDRRAATQMHVISGFDGDGGLLTARNPYSTEFPERMAFFDVDAPDADPKSISFTADRIEFIGCNGSMRAPAALLRAGLSGRLGAGLDPCAAIQVPLTLDPGEQSEIVFRLGMGTNHGAARELAQRVRGVAAAHRALDEVRSHWSRTLETVQVETPDASLDALANGWLLYQTIGCRYLARSGFYQSGGAFGFRDQLQDGMAMLHAEPQTARAHLLRCAARQFPEGDVQHWWHPPLGRGVRTRCSDDFLWLPQAVCRYVEVTADRSVLDAKVPYIEGRPLNPGEESYYDLPTPSTLEESLYQHCVRAIERASGLLGERGLPLMGSGDWNDGMNRVGAEGRGESVWLGFFLFDVLTRFGAIAQARNDLAVAERCEQTAAQLRENLERHAWDGAWYRRAWYDSGTPLGSARNDECRIDSVAQSWSVLSGAGETGRARRAMASLDQHLVRRESGLVLLLQPPFDKTVEDPGYIRGYVPGVRENGGQYTHAAIWASMAFAKLGDHERAWELMRMLNPLHHGDSAESIATYRVEPYVVAADVYALAPHTGRGGWTWYTGSAGWMYRLIIESLLGLRVEGTRLRLAPCLPPDWPEYKMSYRHRDTWYRIHVRQTADVGQRSTLHIDGIEQPSLEVPLQNDRAQHEVEVVLAAGIMSMGQEKTAE